MPLSHPQGKSRFQTTNWSVIAKLESPDFAEATTVLCEQYWFPVYAFIRRRCGDVHRAEDLTQSFFAKALEKQTFHAANRDQGRFRSYLLTTVKNFLANDHATHQTQRRGGSVGHVSIDFVTADHHYLRNCSASSLPEDDFDRAWAVTVLERAIERLWAEYQVKNRLKLFELLAPVLQSASLDYAKISAELAITEVAVRKAASRFRQQYGQHLRTELVTTLGDEGDLDDEIAWMRSLFAR